MGCPARARVVLTALAGIPRANIPTVAGPEALEPRYVNHQLTVNRCLLAIRQACGVHPGAALCEWTADPHARVRYPVGRTWRTMHPDAVAELIVNGRRRWMYLEVDRGTAELRRYSLKLRRYSRFYLSGSWRRHYDQFPELGIVTTHRPRMLAEAEDALRSSSPAEGDALRADLTVAVTWEPTFLTDPSAAVWTRTFAGERREPMLSHDIDSGAQGPGHVAKSSSGIRPSHFPSSCGPQYYGNLDSQAHARVTSCGCRTPRAPSIRRGPAAGIETTGLREVIRVSNVGPTTRGEAVCVGCVGTPGWPRGRSRGQISASAYQTVSGSATEWQFETRRRWIAVGRGHSFTGGRTSVVTPGCGRWPPPAVQGISEGGRRHAPASPRAVGRCRDTCNAPERQTSAMAARQAPNGE